MRSKRMKRDANVVEVFELDRQNKVLKTVVFGFVLIAIALGLFVLIDGFQNKLHSGLLKQVLSDVATTTFSLAIVGLVFEFINRENNDRQLSSSITDAIIMSQKVLNKLSEESKFTYIQNLLRVVIGDGRGDALYQAYIRPFEQHRADLMFRSLFKYDITFLPKSELNEPAPIAMNQYHQVVEELEYEKFFPRIEELKGQQLYLVSALKEEDLRPYFGDMNCIYRNILNLHESDAQMIAMSEEPEKLLRSIYRVTVRINDKDIATRVVYEEGVFKVLLLNAELPQTHDVVHFYISVETLQRKQQNFYSVYISEPSRSPEISFHYNSEMTDVHSSQYFNAVNKEDIREWRNDKARTMTLKVINNKWVFPTSGVVFVWSRADDAKRGELLVSQAALEAAATLS